MSVHEAIAAAEALLPGQSAPDGSPDPRWEAIIEVSEFLDSEPNEVWAFASRWGVHSDPDLRAAIATCILEHLLEEHFDAFFPKVAVLAKSNPHFAQTVRLCHAFGQSELPQNAARLNALLADLRKVV